MTLEFRDKDIAVLQAIQAGASDTREIHEDTSLSIREINYSISEYSLEEQGFVDVHRPDGREWREINGQNQHVWKPKQVTLTDRGIRALAEFDAENTRYDDMSRDELIQNVQELEDRLDRLENAFKNFRTKVIERI